MSEKMVFNVGYFKNDDGTYREIMGLTPVAYDDREVKADIEAVSQELEKVARKKRIDLTGTTFTTKDDDGLTVTLTFADVYNMLETEPDFVYLVYGDRSYLPCMIKKPSVGDSKWRISFTSPIIDGVTAKTGEVEIVSANGTAIESVNKTSVNSENQSNKVSGITDDNKGSTTYYPSVKAVADYVDSDVTEIKEDLSALGLTVVDGMLCAKYEEV